MLGGEEGIELLGQAEDDARPGGVVRQPGRGAHVPTQTAGVDLETQAKLREALGSQGRLVAAVAVAEYLGGEIDLGGEGVDPGHPVEHDVVLRSRQHGVGQDSQSQVAEEVEITEVLSHQNAAAILGGVQAEPLGSGRIGHLNRSEEAEGRLGMSDSCNMRILVDRKRSP